MFDISATLATGSTLINGYGQSSFTVNGTPHNGSICINGSEITPQLMLSAQDITLEALEVLVSNLTPLPEILLIGTGKEHYFIPPSVRNALKTSKHISMDSMATGAACRTYNVLISEGRRVAALLLPV